MTDDQLLKKPIVILGAPRSGTTVLSQLLRRHPDAHLLDEPRIVWKYGNDAKSDLLRAADARPEVREHIRRDFARRIAADGKSRMLEKTPSNSLRVEFVDAVFPDCILVHVMRDAEQSVLSIRRYWEMHSTGVSGERLLRRLKEVRLRQAPHYARELMRRTVGKLSPGAVGPAVWGPRLPGIDQMLREMELLEVCACQWRQCVERACRAGRRLPTTRYAECRLEDLGEPLLRKIMEFCELSPAEEVLLAFREEFDASQPGRRTGEVDSEELARVRDYVAPTTAWLRTLSDRSLGPEAG